MKVFQHTGCADPSARHLRTFLGAGFFPGLPWFQLQHFFERCKNDLTASSGVVSHQEEIQKKNTLNLAFSPFLPFFSPANKSHRRPSLNLYLEPGYYSDFKKQ